MSLSKEKKLEYIDKTIAFCLMGLVIILPIAHTTTIRALLLWIPVFFWVVKMIIERRCGLKRTPFEIPMFIFFITILISFFTSLKLITSISELRGEFLTYTTLFYLVTNNVKKEKYIQNLVSILFLGSLVMAVYAIVDYLIHSDSIFSMSYRTGSLHQGFGAYAQYIIMVVPFNILAFFYRKDLAGKAILFSLILLNCSALYLTHTRGAWIALYVEVLLVVIFTFKGHIKRWGTVAFMTTAILLTVLVLPESVVWHGAKGVDPNNVTARNTVETRMIVWRNTVNEFVKAPFKPAGYGKVNFKRRFPDSSFEQAHNTFINTAVQLGIQGLITLLFIIYAILKMSWSIWKRGETEFQRNFSLAVFIMTAGFFTANQFAEFYIDDTALLFWLFVGICTSIYTQNLLILSNDKKH